MKKRTRCGQVKLNRDVLNMSNNQYVSNGKTSLCITHYRDGHYSVSVNGKPAQRVNAEYASALAGSRKALVIEQKKEEKNMKVHISTKNRKMGKTPSFSTSPIAGCSSNCSVCKGTCYAIKSYCLYPSVRTAWDENLVLSITTWGRAKIEREIISFCTGKRKPVPYFRWFVSGDIISTEFMLSMCRIAKACCDTTFLAFTKSYSIVNKFCDKFGKNTIPKNLVIIYSEWKPLPLDNPHNFPVAVFVPHGETVPERGVVCPAGLEKSMTCAKCRRCWFMTSNDRVAFLEH